MKQIKRFALLAAVAALALGANAYAAKEIKIAANNSGENTRSNPGWPTHTAARQTIGAMVSAIWTGDCKTT